jgi:hypothetical protein
MLIGIIYLKQTHLILRDVALLEAHVTRLHNRVFTSDAQESNTFCVAVL